MSNYKVEKIFPKEVDLNKWYTSVLKAANLISYSLVKGCFFIEPNAIAIWDQIKKHMNASFTKLKAQNVYFPLLIPSSLFLKEKKMLASFQKESYQIDFLNKKKLEFPLYLRPTSEALFMYYFGLKLLRSKNMPIILNQWCSVYRYELNTRPFLRSCEILWQEMHALFATKIKNRQFVKKVLNVYKNFLEKICLLPTIVGKKTNFEKFQGAKSTYTTEVVLSDGKVLQCATSHDFENHFAKIFNLKAFDSFNKTFFPFSSSMGLSTRILGAIILNHGDNNGLKIPSKLAVHKIIIISVISKKEVIDYIKKLKLKLRIFNPICDISKNYFGKKITKAEIEGFPIRIEVGLKEVKNNQISIVTRNDLKRVFLKNDNNIVINLRSILKQFDQSLYIDAQKKQKKFFYKLNSFQEYKKIILEKNIVALVPFCLTIKCEEQIKEETMSTSRCIPLKQEKLLMNQKCFRCQKKAKKYVYFSKSY